MIFHKIARQQIVVALTAVVDNVKMKSNNFLLTLIGSVVTAAIVGLLGWIASSTLANHDQLISLQSQLAEISSSRARLTDLEKRLQEVEYWQRYHGAQKP